MAGSITQSDREFVETWENIASYQNGIIRLDPRGDEKQEMISGPRTFMITTQERLITQDRVADKRNDPFSNGSFRPIVVPEDVTIETNPNALSDEEILDIFKCSDFAWGEYMEVIDSPATLNRMIDLADDDRAEGITVRRLREIQIKLRKVQPQKRLTSSDPQLQKFLDTEQARQEAAAQAAQGEQQAQGEQRQKVERRRGGRSQDYRPN